MHVIIIKSSMQRYGCLDFNYILLTRCTCMSKNEGETASNNAYEKSLIHTFKKLNTALFMDIERNNKSLKSQFSSSSLD